MSNKAHPHSSNDKFTDTSQNFTPQSSELPKEAATRGSPDFTQQSSKLLKEASSEESHEEQNPAEAKPAEIIDRSAESPGHFGPAVTADLSQASTGIATLD